MVATLALILMGSCVSERPLEIPDTDPLEFETVVYPILLRDCGFPECHGEPQRFFVVYGPGRTRLSSATAPHDPPTAEELALTYSRATAMLISEDGIRESPLLRKPLAIGAGGASHRGDDPWGSAVYESKRDPNWQALFFWAVRSAGEPGAP